MDILTAIVFIILMISSCIISFNYGKLVERIKWNELIRKSNKLIDEGKCKPLSQELQSVLNKTELRLKSDKPTRL